MNIFKNKYLYFVKQLATCILLQFVFLAVAAQSNNQLKFHHLTLSDGLSNNSIRCILQDSQGFMWFGTYNGLNRYDGYTFEVFRHQLSVQYSIADNHINFLYEDSQKELWIATNSGLSKYDRKHNRFISYNIFDGNITNAIWEDSQKNLWVSSYNFIYKLDNKTNRFIQYPKFTDAIINSAITLPDHTFLIGTQKAGLYHIDTQTNKIKQYLNNPDDANTLCHNEITALKLENNQKVWISTRNGLDVFNTEKSSFSHIGKGTDPQKSLLFQSIRCGVHFKENEVWVGTQAGISILNTKSNQFRHYSPNIFNPRSLNDGAIWALIEDKQGRMWIGTHSGGINIIDPLREQFTGDSPFLEEGIISAILEDSKNRLWISTEKGLLLKDKENSYLFSFTPNQPKSIPTNTILNIFEDVNKNIWIGTWNGGLSKFDEQSKDFINFEVNPQNPIKLASRNVYSIAQSSLTKQLLIASFDGFHILTSEEDQTFLNYKHNPSDKTSLSANFCRVVFEDSKKNIWIGTDKGFNHFDIQSKKFTRFIHNKSNTRSISNNYINCIFEDSKQRLWIATANGLNLMSNENQFKVYLNTDASFNYIQSILEDNNGNLWLSNISGGISKFNPTNQIFENYNEFNTSFTNEFRSNSSYKGKDGKLYFGGVKGLFSFYPDKIKKNLYPISVSFTDLNIFNQSIKIGEYDSLLTQHISSSKELVFNHTLSVFSIEYLGLNYTNSEKNQYAYKLEGFDKDWVYVGNKREATYTNLDAGTYTFRMKASNNDGLWNDEGASITITILPPWWETWWFRTLIITLFLSSGIAFYLIRINAVKKQNKKLEKTVTERTLEIHQQKEEIATQNEELKQQQENLVYLNNVLEKEVTAKQQLIESKNKEILNYALFIAENNEFLADLKKNMLDLSISAHEIKPILSKIDTAQSKDKDWENFRLMFEAVNPDFFKYLIAEHPQLTAQELKLCALIKLNLSSKEIASILSIASESVYKARYRIRKKMNIDSEDNLNDMLFKL